uniref:Reverse transcriptase domain-containing protein n=1 Tax=Fagus sylvatica TaxID=28930 RepID=A0A2N9EFE1_FAGSY
MPPARNQVPHRSSRRYYNRTNPKKQTNHQTPQTQPILPFLLPHAAPHLNNWALLRGGALRPIGNNLVRWLQSCPNHFWIQIEEALERALREQVPSLLENTHFGRVIINLTTELAIVSPVLSLTEGIPPLWREPRAVIRGLPPQENPVDGNATISELNDTEVLENLTTFLSMESSLLLLPFLAREANLSIIEVHQRVQSFRLLMDRLRINSTQLISYRMVLNPQVRASVELFRDYRRRDSSWRRRGMGRGQTTTILNFLSMKVLLWNCRGAGNPNFRRNFADLKRSHQPTIVVLVETRISGQRAVEVSTALGFDRVIRSDAEGFSGGIWLLWDSGSVTLDILHVNNQAIHATVQRQFFTDLDPDLSVLETIWFNDPSFLSLVHESWTKFPQNVPLAIHDFTNRVTIWNKQVFGNIFHRKKRLLARLNGIQKSLSIRPCPALSNLETDLTLQHQNILHLEGEYWSLKSRLQWTNLGDRNTAFFHLSTICRRHGNKIWCLKNSEGSWCHLTPDIKNLIRNHFVKIYTSEEISPPIRTTNPNLFSSLSDNTCSLLTTPPTRADIEAAIRSFKPLKAPRPDGFHPIFFQKFWNVIGDSITDYIQGIFTKKKIPPNLNSILICLIPKVPNPETVNQFRPIGLCNTLYKTITKILVLKLKPFLSDLIHPLQASFIPGRKASDNVIMVQEIIHSMSLSRSKIGYMAIKIDLEKAYDRLEWSFIRLTLQFYKFPSDWIDLIMSCVSSTTLSVLVNGERLTEFAPSRGIRQGDPLSPYLFIMCMEYLAWLIQVEVESGKWIGVKPTRTGPAFTHLFFADDLVLFAKATSKSCQAINRALGNFCEISGQKVNLVKSSIFLPSRCNISRAPLSRKRTRIQDIKLRKFRTKLASWKARTLLMAGRCTLINSITSAILTHVMQCCLLPTSITKELDKLNRNFLWGDTVEKKKVHLLNWKTITQAKEDGGLGIKRSKSRNLALLASRAWKLQFSTGEAWAKLFKSKYPDARSPHCRKSIVHKGLCMATKICDRGKGWLIQNGLSIKVWQDNWFGPETLREKISEPLSSQDATLRVCDLWDSSNNWELGKISFQLPPSLIQIIKAIPRPRNALSEDKPYWQLSSDGQFNSKSAYKIASNLEKPYSASSSWKWIWKLNTLPRIAYFVWLACHDKLRTAPESFSSSPAPIWQKIGLPTLPDSFSSSNISSWMNACSHSPLTTSIHSVLLFKDIFPILCWTIWTARNKTAFEGAEFNHSTIFKRFSSLAIELKFSLPQKVDKPPKEKILIGWKPPPSGFLKLNTDGSALGNPGLASVGGLIRDSNGNWVRGFSRFIGTTNSFAAELWGLRDGLELARKLDIAKLIVEVDAKAVVDIILSENNLTLETHPYSALIYDSNAGDSPL